MTDVLEIAEPFFKGGTDLQRRQDCEEDSCGEAESLIFAETRTFREL